jgi:hypothetical protein
MAGRCNRQLKVLLLSLGCLGEGCQERGVRQDAPSPASQSTTPVAPVTSQEQPTLDTGELRLVVEQWRRAQDDGDMALYSSLYAADFVGIKRAGDRISNMNRDEWLQDRRSMALKTPRVEVSDLQFRRANGAVVAEFRQKWATQNFADEGQKALTLQKQGASWKIVREAMLTSSVLTKEERARSPEITGHCESLATDLPARERAGQLWRLADIGGEPGPVHWTRVSSWGEAEQRTPYRSVWSSATVVWDGEWLLAYTARFSPSGDSGLLTEQCYRPNGTLANLREAFRTLATLQGLGEDVHVTVFDEQGHPGWTTRHTYLVETGAPLQPEEVQGEVPWTPSKRVSDLPYFAQLPDEIRRRY